MPIQFPDFQRISFDEANPLLIGMSKGQNLMQNFMQFPQELQAKMLANQLAQVQAKYAEPMAKGNLTKLNQENEYNPKIWQSEIGLRGAQTGLTNQQSRWYGPKTKAEIALQGAQTNLTGSEANMNNLKLNYLNSMLGGKGNVSTPSQNSSFQGNGQSNNIQSPESNQSTNSFYGIETPSPTKDDIVNKMLLGMDTFAPKLENAKAQQQDQYKKYQQAIGESVQEANAAQKTKQVLSIFNNAMDNSTYKGPRLGAIHSSGWLAGPGDLTPEQTADTQIANLLPGAINELRESMKSGQFSVADLNAASKMKFSRTMTDDTRATQTKWINGVSNRFDEKAKFYSMMGNPNSGAEKTVADQLFEQYQRDFPLISEDGKKYNEDSLGNWPLYTTPKAISSIKSTGTYSPTTSEKNTFMMKYPDGRILPVKRGGVETAFRKGARPL